MITASMNSGEMRRVRNLDEARIYVMLTKVL